MPSHNTIFFSLFTLGFSLFFVFFFAPLRMVHAKEALPEWDRFSPASDIWLIVENDPLELASLDPDGSVSNEEKAGVKGFFLDSLVIYVGSWPFILALDQNTREGIFNSSTSRWIDNMSQPPVWNDGSSWLTNNVAHPFLGATYFLYYRCRDHGFLASSLGVVLQTILFEYTIEGIHVRPSLQDLVKTPGMGIPLGYAMDELSLYFLKKQEEPLRYLGYFFNPFNLLPWAKDRWHAAIDPLNNNLAFSIKF
jgi:hypothetical protein